MATSIFSLPTHGCKNYFEFTAVYFFFIFFLVGVAVHAVLPMTTKVQQQRPPVWGREFYEKRFVSEDWMFGEK